MLDIGFKFIAKDSLIFFCTIFALQFSGGILLFFFLLNSLSFFVLFTTYVIGQIELIVLFAEQLNTEDEFKFSAGLKEVVELHLNVLK